MATDINAISQDGNDIETYSLKNNYKYSKLTIFQEKIFTHKAENHMDFPKKIQNPSSQWNSEFDPKFHWKHTNTIAYNGRN